MKDSINRKKVAFMKKDRAELKVVQKEFNKLLLEARKRKKGHYWTKLMNNKKLWDSLKIISIMDSKDSVLLQLKILKKQMN